MRTVFGKARFTLTLSMESAVGLTVLTTLPGSFLLSKTVPADILSTGLFNEAAYRGAEHEEQET